LIEEWKIMPRVRPSKFAHVVYRTRRFEEMLAWYQVVFDAQIQHRDAVLAFMTYDDEHHRFALVNLAALPHSAVADDERGLVGVDHVAYTYASLADLLKNYEQLKAHGILPYWCVHHGMTVSMYYADPDGNQMEFQVDAFPSSAESNAFMRSPINAANPIGVEYDPEHWLHLLREGTPSEDLLVRRVHEPMSPIRGKLGE